MRQSADSPEGMLATAKNYQNFAQFKRININYELTYKMFKFTVQGRLLLELIFKRRVF